MSPTNPEAITKSFSQNRLFNPYVINPESQDPPHSEERSMSISRSRKFKASKR